MLFQLSSNTPRFRVFSLLNSEFIYFIEQSVAQGEFRRELFSEGAVGQACWSNSKVNDVRASKDLTRDKFEKLFSSLQGVEENVRQELLDVFRDNQDLQAFFNAPSRNLLEFLPLLCQTALKNVATHLYCATKDIAPIIAAAGGLDITAHFNLFRGMSSNGKICKACGMKELAAFRAGVADGDQWRADYDHQLCKSKYPTFAVHPDNLIPLCDVCNQDAKKAKDLFKCDGGNERLAFYPYAEEARELIAIEIQRLRDPEPTIKLVWSTDDAARLNKLQTWDDIYEIRSRVEGRFSSLEVVIDDEINPAGIDHLRNQINDKARPVVERTLKRKEWSFWYQKLFQQLNLIDIAPFWEKSQFVHRQGIDGGEYILAGVQN
ncbi:hypothetical protein [Pseudomonas psychrophila]|uniref:hypothetical protein n=1 Tax=Pseudomonas psychrophila TaxID=122355 RepID=UPI00035832C8|nr:hypothetical protein [Pseudomonas psychrophila]EPJ95148.1 hypothetical protein CF149_07279 [Pseudomonas psychrophila]